MPSIDGGDDFIGICGPAEWVGIMIGLYDESADGALEFDNRTEDATLEPVLGELGKEALDSVEPRAGGRGEVEDEAWMAGLPGLDPRQGIQVNAHLS